MEMGVAISALPILAEGVLEKLRKVLGFDTRGEAARFWLAVYSATLPFIHERLARLIGKSPGAPDVERVSRAFRDDRDLVDLTPDPATHEAKAKENS